MVYLICIYFSYGGLYSVFPAITYKIFGQLHGAKIYGMVFFGFALGSWLQFLLHFIMVDQYGKKGHEYSFWTFAGMQGLAIVVVAVTRWRIDWPQKESLISEFQTSE